MSKIRLPFRIVIRGKGGHGSRPANCINPVDCFAALHGALKAEADALPACAVKIEAVDGASKANIIRDDLSFCGAFLCDTQEQAQRISRRLPAIVEAVCAAFRCTGEVAADGSLAVVRERSFTGRGHASLFC